MPDGGQVSVKLLMHELDPGESEALIQAQERRAAYFIGDERRARQIGKNMGIKSVGTVGLLARLHLEGLADETRGLVRKLRKDLKCRIADELVEEAIARASESI